MTKSVGSINEGCGLQGLNNPVGRYWPKGRVGTSIVDNGSKLRLLLSIT